jgi:hypothetical protein
MVPKLVNLIIQNVVCVGELRGRSPHGHMREVADKSAKVRKDLHTDIVSYTEAHDTVGLDGVAGQRRDAHLGKRAERRECLRLADTYLENQPDQQSSEAQIKLSRLFHSFFFVR